MYLLKVNQGKTKAMCHSLTDFTLRSGVFIVDFE